MNDSDPAGDTAASHGEEAGCCSLCERSVPLTFHHLIPRRNHRRARFRRLFSLDDMRARGVWLCHSCHRAVHRFFDEQTLGLRLNTLDALKGEPAIQRHVAWAARQRRR